MSSRTSARSLQGRGLVTVSKRVDGSCGHGWRGAVITSGSVLVAVAAAVGAGVVAIGVKDLVHNPIQETWAIAKVPFLGRTWYERGFWY